MGLQVTSLKVWSIPNRQGSLGATWGPPKAGGEMVTVDQQKAEWEDPSRGHKRPGKKISFLNCDVSLCTRNQHLLAYLKTTPVVIS